MGSSVITPEDVLETLMNDGTIDAIRLKIINQLKANEELKNTTITMVEQSKVLNTPGAERQTKRELFDALRQELETPVLEKASKSVWELILDNDGLGKEISETVEKVYCRLSGQEPPLFPQPNSDTPQPEKDREKEKEEEEKERDKEKGKDKEKEGTTRISSFREGKIYGMQSLQEKAAEWSGVKAEDAFAIDSTNLFQTLGLQTFIDLSTNFYTRVYEDEEEWFRSIFSSSTKEDAIRNQYEFFVQRMGGPPLYSQRKGHPALIGRHRPFPVTHEAADRWLQHMQHALDSVPSIDADSKVKMMNFFRHTAFFIVAGNELKNKTPGVSTRQGN